MSAERMAVVAMARRHGWCCLDVHVSYGCMVLMHANVERVLVVCDEGVGMMSEESVWGERPEMYSGTAW